MKFIRTLVGNFFCFVVPGVTFFLIIVFTVSPHAFSSFIVWADNPVRARAAIESCELVRDGVKRSNAIRCEARYAHGENAYKAVVNVWSSQSPFATLASLDWELVRQRAIDARDVTFSERHPASPTVFDERILAMPGLPALLIALFFVLVGLAVYREPRSRVHRRSDYILDRETDELVPINTKRTRRVRGQSLLWSAVVVYAMLACVYGLSSRLPKEISLLALPALQAQSAQLIGCEHNYYGTRKGHDQIDCRFQYDVQGKMFTGQAESLDFRFIPTDKRMDAKVAQLEGTQTTAWINPAHPTYAWALIEPGWLVPYTFGLFELMLLILLVGVLPIALVVVGRRSLRTSIE